MKNGATIVSHTETYGINITGSSEFAIGSSWAIQPGISSYSKGTPLGSWLPQIAANFDSYEMQSLRFNYRAACSTLQPGLAIFAFEPNPEGNTPSSYQELRNMMSVDGSVHSNLSFDVGPRVRKELLTRKGSVLNLPSYDAGKIFFATVGCDEGAKLGFIDVTYTVKLFNPQSSASTTIPNIVYEQIRPVQRFIGSVSSGTSATVDTNSRQAFVQLLQASTTDGATNMFTLQNWTYPASDETKYGCKFAQSASAGWRTLLTNFSGRYRVTACFNGDFKDLNLFAMALYATQAGSAAPASLCRRAVLDSVTGQSTTDLEILPYTMRGFSGTAVSDPNPATDLPFMGTWDIDLEVGQTLSVALGIRTYNNASSGATFTYRDGTGPSFIQLEFLGPK